MKRTVRHFLRGDARDVKLYELDTDAPGVVDGDGYRVKERLFEWRGFGVVRATGDEEVQEVPWCCCERLTELPVWRA